jgi:small-conductance mechanosensitive channel
MPGFSVFGFDATTVGERALLVVVLLAATWVAARIVTRLFAGYLRLHPEALPSASLITTLASIAVWSIGLLLVVQSLGIAITPVLTALGVGGLAVALALKDTLENLFSGLQIIASGQIRAGDYIKLEGGIEGYVSDITWRTTTVKDLSDNLVVVPNSKFAQTSFTNYALPARELSVSVPVLVPYDADLALVERATLEAARQVLRENGSATETEPSLHFTELGNENIKLTVILRLGAFADQFKVRSDFIRRLHARYRNERIGSPFPARTAEPASGSASDSLV